MDVGVCRICGHLYERISNTQDVHKVAGQCWCEGLVRSGFLEEVEDYPEFWKKCLLDSLPRLERIGINCEDCKKKKECEDGGTNINFIIENGGYCEDIIL